MWVFFLCVSDSLMVGCPCPQRGHPQRPLWVCQRGQHHAALQVCTRRWGIFGHHHLDRQRGQRHCWGGQTAELIWNWLLAVVSHKMGNVTFFPFLTNLWCCCSSDRSRSSPIILQIQLLTSYRRTKAERLWMLMLPVGRLTWSCSPSLWRTMGSLSAVSRSHAMTQAN